MIGWLVYKLLPLLYGVEEVNHVKCAFMAFSAAELMVEIFILAGICIIHLPDIVRRWRWK